MPSRTEYFDAYTGSIRAAAGRHSDAIGPLLQTLNYELVPTIKSIHHKFTTKKIENIPTSKLNTTPTGEVILLHRQTTQVH